MHDENLVTYFAETDSRNKRVPFGIMRKDRSRHTYVIGKTGMGKSTLLENMAVQDIKNGEGFAFIDPHGKSADLLLEYIPESRIKDVLYFAPFDMEYPISFNVMEDVGPDKRHLVANGLMSAFKKIWVDAWSARMEYILNNILLALLEYPGSTLIGVNRMLADKEYRKRVVDNITDPSVKAFWTDEYAKYTDKFAAEAAPAIQNKIGQFISNPLVRNIIGQPKSTFDIRKLMDERKILIINLSKGRVGESNANLLGSMLITKIYLAAMSRADLGEEDLKTKPNFFLYVDEFQNFANESFADILSEARKYKLNLTVAHQYIEQMSEEVRAAVFGNVGTMITFRVGAFDAEFLEKEYAPTFTAEDLVNLGRFQLYIKLMIDGVSSPPFSATGMPPIAKEPVSHVKEIIDASRATFARSRTLVEEEIKVWHQPIGSLPNPAKPQDSQPQQSFTPRPTTEAPRRFPAPSNVPSGAPIAPSRERREAPRVESHSPREASREPQRRPGQGMSREARVSQETELRKAMSLDYLKPKEEPEHKKIPTAKNVADLRDALLSVLKDAPSAAPALTQQPAPVSKPAPVEAPKTHHQSAPHASPALKPSEPKQPEVKEVAEEVLRKLLHVDEA
jgi:hypothetical protein